MTLPTPRDMSFEAAVAAARTWIGHEARLELGAQAAIADVAVFHGLTLDRVEELPQEDRILAGEGYFLIFRDSNMADTAALTLASAQFQGGIDDPGVELSLYLAGANVHIWCP